MLVYEIEKDWMKIPREKHLLFIEQKLTIYYTKNTLPYKLHYLNGSPMETTQSGKSRQFAPAWQHMGAGERRIAHLFPEPADFHLRSESNVGVSAPFSLLPSSIVAVDPSIVLQWTLIRANISSFFLHSRPDLKRAQWQQSRFIGLGSS